MSWNSFARSLWTLAALVGLVCWLSGWWLGTAVAVVVVIACVVIVLSAGVPWR